MEPDVPSNLFKNLNNERWTPWHYGIGIKAQGTVLPGRAHVDRCTLT